MKACIFISDEGYGHLVRQRAIISELIKKKISVKVVGSQKIIVLKEKFGNKIEYIISDNLIKTIKNQNGSLNIKLTKKMFQSWFNKESIWLKNNTRYVKNCDFIISDFMPSAFELSKILRIPSFGICHFTWDWFYKKIYKKNDKTYKKLTENIRSANMIFFPPFTFNETLKKYRHQVKNVNFILTDFNKKKRETRKKKRFLIMDNGNYSLRNHIIKSLPYLKKINDKEFVIRTDSLNAKQKKIITRSKNLLPVEGLRETHEKVMDSDYIIARGGFNTISECLIFQKPSLLFYERGNPEIQQNLKNFYKSRLCDLLMDKDWGKNIENKIQKFLKKTNSISKNLRKQKYKDTGAKEIVQIIIKSINNYKVI